MNFVLISPHFPQTYWQFAQALKQNGINVLGIGDAPDHELSFDLKNSLTEYYHCPWMNDYRELYRAFAYFAFKYGKIDWIESNNEYWLESDARLRTDFNVTTGIQSAGIRSYKAKSEMKRHYREAGVPTAAYRIVDDLEGCRAFIAEIGFPVFVKPNVGVGASSSYKIGDEADLIRFFTVKENREYIMEEYIDGTIVSFDGIADAEANVAFCASNVFPVPNHVIVNDLADDFYYTLPAVPEDLEKIGRATIKAFGVRNRFFHLEFFRLDRASARLGAAGDIVALEVNMRPAGGYTPEMINAASGVSVHRIWADVLAFGVNRQPASTGTCYCAEAARRDCHRYLHSHEEIMAKYGCVIVMADRYPPVINVGMGDQFYIVRLTSLEAVKEFRDFVLTPTAE
jgi:hypothetical protein